MGLHMRNHTDFEALGTNAAVGLRAPPLALWVLLRRQNEGPCCLRCRLRPWQWVTPACAAGCHFLSRKVTAGLANMEERAAWASECVFRGSMQATPAEQLTRKGYVRYEAVEPMAKVSTVWTTIAHDHEAGDYHPFVVIFTVQRFFPKAT